MSSEGLSSQSLLSDCMNCETHERWFDKMVVNTREKNERCCSSFLVSKARSVKKVEKLLDFSRGKSDCDCQIGS